MSARLPLPPISDLHIRIATDRTTCELDVFTEQEPLREHLESMRRTFAPTLCPMFGDLQIRLERDTAAATRGRDRPRLDYPDPLVRSVLVTVISVAHRPRLLGYAERCMEKMQRENTVQSEDLLQMALALLLAGKLEWRGSLGRMLSTLCAAMRNLSLHPKRAAGRVEALEVEGLGERSTSHDPDRQALRVLLTSDVRTALAFLPEGQRTAAVACWMKGESAAEFAATERWNASTVRSYLHRAKPVLQSALRSYAPPGPLV